MTGDHDDSLPGPDDPTLSRAAGDSRYSAFEGATEDFGIGPGDTDPLIGADIGGVTIVRLIGQGGMGRVYEARQAKPSRPVAVKVIRPGVVSESHMRRFDHEAEILARLRHPGIAQIHTVGTYRSPAGDVPFFVMEYIPDAKTLVDYADHHRLSTHDRLELFRKACDAVAHGHARGVVHRDLKPSNILVDAAGQPKVIDFGVAKTTDVDLALTTMRTDVGQLIGTLQYMSPEQFDGQPDEVDVRSDVYALGVVLYELLTGQPPYDVRRKAVIEAARVVKEEDPTPLSSLNRTLRRDVGVIAGKCLAKEPGGRYSSAAELGADVGRYLVGEPIHASPPGFVDGLVRLGRRHKAAAAAVGLVAVSLVAAVVGISLFAARAERQRQAAAESAAVAEHKRNVSDLNRFHLLQERGETENAFALLDDIESRFKPDDVPVEVRVTRAEAEDAIAVFPGRSFAFSPNGSLLAISEALQAQPSLDPPREYAYLVDSVTGEILTRLEDPHGGSIKGTPRFSTDGAKVGFETADLKNSLFGYQEDCAGAAIWDARDGRNEWTANAARWPSRSTSSRSPLVVGLNAGSKRAVFLEIPFLFGGYPTRMMVHDGPDVEGIVLQRSATVAKSGDGDTVVCLDDEGFIQVLIDLDSVQGTVENQRKIISVSTAGRMRRVLAVSHDGGMVCCETSRGDVCIVAIDAGPVETPTVLAFDDHDVVTSAYFAKAGHTIFTVTVDGVVHAWESLTGKPAWTAETGLAGYPVLSAAPGCRQVAVIAAGAVAILSADDGAMVKKFTCEDRKITCVACSPEDAAFAVGDDEGVVTLQRIGRSKALPQASRW